MGDAGGRQSLVSDPRLPPPASEKGILGLVQRCLNSGGEALPAPAASVSLALGTTGELGGRKRTSPSSEWRRAVLDLP